MAIGFRHRWVLRAALVVGSAVFSILLCEAFVRLALYSNLLPESITQAFRQPALYAPPDTDDFWKLHSRWDTSWQGHDYYHPTLGFTTPRTSANPLGVAGEARPFPDPDSAGPVVLFYGDSYLTTPFMPVAERIPQLLETAGDGVSVWNFGMWSYGLDQIVLRFEATYGHFRNPRVLIGILTDDIERCVLSVREGQKPRFVLDGAGEFHLTNVPIERDRRAYLERNPPAIHSYVLRMARVGLSGTRLRRFVGWSHRVEEKSALASGLVERAVRTSRANEMPVGFVIFYMRHELLSGSWRGRLLRQTFERLDVPYLDTREPLTRAMERGEVSLDALYDPRTEHHTTAANRLIVQAIRDRWPDWW